MGVLLRVETLDENSRIIRPTAHAEQQAGGIVARQVQSCCGLSGGLTGVAGHHDVFVSRNLRQDIRIEEFLDADVDGARNVAGCVVVGRSHGDDVGIVVLITIVQVFEQRFLGDSLGAATKVGCRCFVHSAVYFRLGFRLRRGCWWDRRVGGRDWRVGRWDRCIRGGNRRGGGRRRFRGRRFLVASATREQDRY